MSSFADEFQKYQKQERRATAAIVLIAAVAPISFTYLMKYKVHWMATSGALVSFLFVATVLHFYRTKISRKLLSKYENLEVGAILAKRINKKRSREFVITNSGYNHFYLKCLKTGEQVLVSKSRVREDFDIAN